MFALPFGCVKLALTGSDQLLPHTQQPSALQYHPHYNIWIINLVNYPPFTLSLTITHFLSQNFSSEFSITNYSMAAKDIKSYYEQEITLLYT